jgi:bifunctional non-homologous end joining protein LigD
VKALEPYFSKRNFKVTSEPKGGKPAAGGALSFVIQKHAASHLHYDFRLELDGTLKSWAVPKGPSLDPADRRMAVHVEDHPIDYGGFEGTIPAGQYGAGTVIVWDRGTWEPVGDPRAAYRAGKLKFRLHGEKLSGGWNLVLMHGHANERQESWLLIKERDEAARPAKEYSVVEAEPASVISKRTIEDKPAKARVKAPAAARKAAPAPAAKSKPAGAAPRAAKKASGDASVEGIRISHPERVVDKSTGLTKLDVVNHYLAVSKLILPHLATRPVSLVRAPAGIDGQLFFQKHAESLKIPGLKQLDPKISPDHKPMVEVDSFTALIGAAQANVIEFHTWNATTRDATKPDRMVFDLDPGEGVTWKQIQEGTELTRALLDELCLVAFLKTSGGKGLHVVVPIAPKHDWDTVKALSKAIVEHMATVIPDRFVAKSGPKNRVGKIFVDYLRNGFGATTACAWSARARPGLGVSVPCAWDELGTLTGGAHWTVRNVPERIEKHADPWRAYAKTRQTLAKAGKTLGVL